MKAGAVVDVGGGGGAPGQGGVEAHVEGVALVVVDGRVGEAASQAGSPMGMQMRPPVMLPRCSAIWLE